MMTLHGCRQRSGTSMASVCADCGMDTTPCTGRRGCRHAGRWEYYRVHDTVWAAAGMSSGYLCIGCLERRLGRSLTRKDFPDNVMINRPGPWHTPRLADRIRG